MLKGRFSTAANNQKQIAEIYEQDFGRRFKCVSCSDFSFLAETCVYRQANGCFLKVAQFAGTLEDYDRAIDLFERVASKSLDNNLTKWSVREYLFKAMICVLCLKVSIGMRFLINADIIRILYALLLL
jgi:alpha-soluble NSF attachment protein